MAAGVENRRDPKDCKVGSWAVEWIYWPVKKESCKDKRGRGQLVWSKYPVPVIYAPRLSYRTLVEEEIQGVESWVEALVEIKGTFKIKTVYVVSAKGQGAYMGGATKAFERGLVDVSYVDSQWKR
jgi:hypothetical protein